MNSLEQLARDFEYKKKYCILYLGKILTKESLVTIIVREREHKDLRDGISEERPQETASTSSRDGINEHKRRHQQAQEIASTRRTRTDRRVHERQH